MTNIKKVNNGGTITLKRNPDYVSQCKGKTYPEHGGAFILGDIADFVDECFAHGATRKTEVIAGMASDKKNANYCEDLWVATDGAYITSTAAPVILPWYKNPLRVGAAVSIFWMLFGLLLMAL